MMQCHVQRSDESVYNCLLAAHSIVQCYVLAEVLCTDCGADQCISLVAVGHKLKHKVAVLYVQSRRLASSHTYIKRMENPHDVCYSSYRRFLTTT